MGNKPTAANPDQLLDISMDMKIAARQLQKESSKVEGMARKEKAKIRDALNKGNTDNAKIYAENAIRNQKEAANLMRFSVKMEAVATKLEAAYRTQNISSQIARTVPLLTSCMKQMDQIGIHGAVGSFDKIFEDLDVKTGELNSALENVYTSGIDQNEVNSLIDQVKDEQGMGVKGEIPGARSKELGYAEGEEMSEMQKKLDMLKQI